MTNREKGIIVAATILSAGLGGGIAAALARRGLRGCFVEDTEIHYFQEKNSAWLEYSAAAFVVGATTFLVSQYPRRKKKSAEEADDALLAVEDDHGCDTATDWAQQRSNSCYAERCDAIFESSADNHFWLDQPENDLPFSIVRYRRPAPPSLHELPDDEEILTAACSADGTTPPAMATFPAPRQQTITPTTQRRSRVSPRRGASREPTALDAGYSDRTGHSTLARTALRNRVSLSCGSPKPPKQLLHRKTVQHAESQEFLSMAEPEGKSSRLSFIFFLVCLLISGFCFFQGITSDTYQQPN